MKVIVNGKTIESEIETLYVLKRKTFSSADDENMITILNGYQTSKDYKLKDLDEVTFIKRGCMPDKNEFERMMCARHTPDVFEKVKKAKVAVCGLGGLGSNVAVSLARTGVGFIHLIDFDIVEPSNLNRQMYRVKDLGRYKTEALKEEISEINPYVKVKIDTVKINEKNVAELLKDDEIICEAFDNPEAKSMLVNTVLESLKGKKIVAASGMAGYESNNLIKTKKINDNFYLCGDYKTGAKVGQGLMAPRVSICAGHEANMILRLILGISEE